MSRSHAKGELPLRAGIGSDDGIALVVTLLVVMMMAALGGALGALTSTETAIAANVEDGTQAVEAARSAAELAIGELSVLADWHAVLLGQISSGLNDGPAGLRRLPDSRTMDLTGETGRLNCGQPRPCHPAELVAVTARRPWGANNPAWVLFAHGPLEIGRAHV